MYKKIEFLLHILNVAHNPQLFYDVKDMELSRKLNLIDSIEEELSLAIKEAEDYELNIFVEFINSIT